MLAGLWKPMAGDGQPCKLPLASRLHSFAAATVICLLPLDAFSASIDAPCSFQSMMC